MSLTPDYFISSSGYPQLNREKFKLSTGGASAPTSSIKFRRNSSVGLHNKNLRCHTCDSSDKKKLLKKRARNHVVRDVIGGLGSGSSTTTTPKWSTDKEHKCYINQQIKEMESVQSDLSHNSTTSRQQLDNRLVDEARYFSGILRDNETEVLVLQQLDF